MKNKQVHARHSLYSPVRRLKDGTLELAKAEFSHKTESPYAGALSDEFSIVSEMPVNVNFFYLHGYFFFFSGIFFSFSITSIFSFIVNFEIFLTDFFTST